ncbi:hypothetical protein J4Q44_G00081940 [Coregonus suidteri]|uniref:Uncharacterized protein n=1 Tax=Coregonus suidteri TaxID=861788 RepID=A0AAN8M0H1_9TELE
MFHVGSCRHHYGAVLRNCSFRASACFCENREGITFPLTSGVSVLNARAGKDHLSVGNIDLPKVHIRSNCHSTGPTAD